MSGAGGPHTSTVRPERRRAAAESKGARERGFDFGLRRHAQPERFVGGDVQRAGGTARRLSRQSATGRVRPAVEVRSGREPAGHSTGKRRGRIGRVPRPAWGCGRVRFGPDSYGRGCLSMRFAFHLPRGWTSQWQCDKNTNVSANNERGNVPGMTCHARANASANGRAGLSGAVATTGVPWRQDQSWSGEAGRRACRRSGGGNVDVFNRPAKWGGTR